MKKIACLSALACVVALSTSTAFAVDNTSTVSVGYAQGDAQGVVNKAKGFNLKYRYEFESTPWGVVGSLTYLNKSHSPVENDYQKGEYYGVTVGPSYRINDWVSAYGLVGMGVGKFEQVGNASSIDREKGRHTDGGVAYGAGLQFNPIENVALDFSYEQSRVKNVDIGTWIAGVGYRF